MTRMSPVHYSTSLSLMYPSIALPADSFFQNAPHSKTLLSQHSHNLQPLTLNGLKLLVRHSRSSVLFDRLNIICAFGFQLLENSYSASSLESIGGF